MFTGLVESANRVAAVRTRADAGIDLDLDLGALAEGVRLGDSISVSGVCLTVAKQSGEIVTFEISPETLARTRLGSVATGEKLNVERSLQIGARLGGHWVQGHVDGVARVNRLHHFGEWAELDIQCSPALGRYCVEKGSICLDGVSLTIAKLVSDPGGNVIITIALVPHTLERTTIGACKAGDPIHVESDILAKYVEKLTQPYAPGK
ncbi:MAG: riboflavin synthase [Planctomycetota bacterium]